MADREGRLPALAGKGTLNWKGTTYKLDALPEELGPHVAETARPWAAWAAKKGYRLELSDEADVLLVVAKRQRKVERDLELLARTRAAVDLFLEPRARPWCHPGAIVVEEACSFESGGLFEALACPFGIARASGAEGDSEQVVDRRLTDAVRGLGSADGA